ncbi:hypothetical protein EVAR_37688_1 [Eumeta japonica]|uniref:Uncharacterized protein n=1 Tax=Eumeta variegata TaxID=151549 RepID=A0A4C1XQA6_EUMVA|nr:hypothetical protein EVAR_37688_1 [Eumeta japonica]
MSISSPIAFDSDPNHTFDSDSDSTLVFNPRPNFSPAFNCDRVLVLDSVLRTAFNSDRVTNYSSDLDEAEQKQTIPSSFVFRSRLGSRFLCRSNNSLSEYLWEYGVQRWRRFVTALYNLKGTAEGTQVEAIHFDLCVEINGILSLVIGAPCALCRTRLVAKCGDTNGQTYFSLRGEGDKKLMYYPRVRGVSDSTDQNPKRPVGWPLSVVPINWNFEDFICRGRSAWDAVGA